MLIHVKVTTEANHYSIEEKRPTAFNISVKEPALENKANRKVVSMLAEHFKVSPAKIRIITGHHAPGKIFEIEV